jgi:hypothetical protein
MAPVGAGRVRLVDLSQKFGHASGQRRGKRLAAHTNPGLPSSGTGLDEEARFMSLSAQVGQEVGNGVVKVQQDITGIVIAGVGSKVHVKAFAIANA